MCVKITTHVYYWDFLGQHQNFLKNMIVSFIVVVVPEGLVNVIGLVNADLENYD